VIYADANVFIRLLEGDAAARKSIEARLLPLRGTGRFLLTSRLTRLECRVRPLRDGDAGLLALYDVFFAGPEVQILELTESVSEKATEIRARTIASERPGTEQRMAARPRAAKHEETPSLLFIDVFPF